VYTYVYTYANSLIVTSDGEQRSGMLLERNGRDDGTRTRGLCRDNYKSAGTASSWHLRLARANALQARTSKGGDADAALIRALAAYKHFLTLWKDADPDIPILKQAQAEYVKLQ